MSGLSKEDLQVMHQRELEMANRDADILLHGTPEEQYAVLYRLISWAVIEQTTQFRQTTWNSPHVLSGHEYHSGPYKMKAANSHANHTDHWTD